jgi:serine phosphatase RsbU (regulator of sigma subunit)
MSERKFFEDSQFGGEAGATVLELELIDGPRLGRRRWRAGRELRLGRADGCDLVLAEPSISRLHAVIEPDGDGWSLRDCDSRLGTRLNELPLAGGERVALHGGDVVAIGPWRFRIRALAPAESAVGAAAAPHIDRFDRLGHLAEQRLELLLRCAGEVAAAADEQALADTLAEHALLGSGYQRAAVLWQDDDGRLSLRSLRPVGAANDAAFHFNRSLVASAAAGEAVRIDAPREDPSAGLMRCALCAPLMLDGRAQAFLYLDANRSLRRGHADAPTFCQALARLASLALANLRRLDSERERAMLAADIERAREVQHRLLPDDHAPIGGIDCALHLHPGRAVAGDIVDVIALPQGGAAAMLGDVSGAGLGAGLVMASVQSFLRAELAHHADPARALTRLNEHLCAQANHGQFVTLWLGLFDARARSCRFVDAGHGHALRLRAGEAVPIEAPGDIPLGIEPTAVFRVGTLELAADDLVLLYSDGVIERRAPDGTPFGRARLAESVCAAATPREAVAQALAALHAHASGAAPDDDATLLALRP